jgi:hypothetical protein
VQLRIQYFTAAYPAEPPAVELSSPTLPAPLLRTKEKECVEEARSLLGRPQAHAIYEHIAQFIHENLFIPCWKEVKQVNALCEGRGRGQIGAKEKEGLIQLRLQQGQYRQTVHLRVPEMYPEEGVVVDIVQSSFPGDVAHMFQSQAEEISRRCAAGYSPDQTVGTSNSAKMQGSGKAAGGASKERLTAGSIKDLKHDMDVLKQMSDLRTVTAGVDKRKQLVARSTQERREARKGLRRLAKAESEADEKREQEMMEVEQFEMQALMVSKVSDTAQPSLLATAKYLIEEFATTLPLEKCQNCQKNVFPDDPSSAILTDRAHRDRPIRTYCGHWLHYGCLDDWMTTPPFIRQCPVCDRRIWHSDWPDDVKILERAWQNQEAKRRELADVSDLLGF